MQILGYYHETGEADARRMEALERRVLAKLGVADPYMDR
jgi:probable rRNA maturation factor